MERFFFVIGALMAGVAVAAGAYGAHGGPSLDLDQIRWISKAARYQMYHAIALICVSCAMAHRPGVAKFLQISGCFFLLGIIFFSGSLYVMTFTGVDLGYITPAGGVAFITGWVFMAVAGFMSK